MLRIRIAAFSLMLLSPGIFVFAAQAKSQVYAKTTPDIITACVAKATGLTRIVARPSDCIDDLERVVRWNKDGSPGAAGPQGPTGPEGPVGPSGPLGPVGKTGGQTWSASLMLPPSIPERNTPLEGPALGLGVAAPLGRAPTVDLPVPVSCTAQKFRVTVKGARGSSKANVFLAVTDFRNRLSLPVYCAVQANDGANVSCESTMMTVLDPTENVLIYVDLSQANDPADFERSTLKVSFLCQ